MELFGCKNILVKTDHNSLREETYIYINNGNIMIIIPDDIIYVGGVYRVTPFNKENLEIKNKNRRLSCSELLWEKV